MGSRLQYPQRVLRNHQFFVRGNDPCCNPASLGTDSAISRMVRFGIQFNSKPRSIPADTLAYDRRVLTDPSSEDNCI